MAIHDPRDLLDANLAQLEEFLQRGLRETEVLDYKLNIGDDITSTLAAMANSEGGTVIVGVQEDRVKKAPKAWPGFPAKDPLSTLTSHLHNYVDPSLAVRTKIIGAPGPAVFLIIVVEPATRGVVLHRERGILVRHQDQSVAPNRSDFERLLGRERTVTAEAASKRSEAAGAAAHLSGPGSLDSRLTVVVASRTISSPRSCPQRHSTIPWRPSAVFSSVADGMTARLKTDQWLIATTVCPASPRTS
jgi:hypothetical protein